MADPTPDEAAQASLSQPAPRPAPLPPPLESSKNPEISTLLSSWRLTPQASDEIFTSLILPNELSRYFSPTPHNITYSSSSSSSSSSASRRAPLAVIILGQTGSGKTRLAPILSSHFPPIRSSSSSSSSSSTEDNNQPIHLIADVYKTYHPHFLACPEPHRSRLASDDARRWLKLACIAVAQQENQQHGRKDVLLESACRRPEDFIELIEIFREGGYRVRVAVLAVGRGVSRLGCLVRYWRNLPEAGAKWGLGVRKTPAGVHSESYEGLSRGVGRLDGMVVVAAAADGVGVSGNHDGTGGEQERKKEEEREKGIGGNDDIDDIDDIDNDGGGRRAGIRENLRVKTKGMVDRVAVIRRGGEAAYLGYADGSGDELGRAREALERERRRPLSETELEAAREDLEMLRRAGEGEVDEVEAMINALGTGEKEGEEEWPELRKWDIADFVGGGLE
ncbi:zeta toxin-domain-containing protein [Cladorrhinum samala]|uniref:Zeta toxin-domain-containing protein n=1 Tax=Cladorrhinum samala TaxID=585594 RepID=A0AAV9HY99_9PEZI|nr:zeta toxin-domain-containing protein [Cladorrhinum samala]